VKTALYIGGGIAVIYLLWKWSQPSGSGTPCGCQDGASSGLAGATMTPSGQSTTTYGAIATAGLLPPPGPVKVLVGYSGPTFGAQVDQAIAADNAPLYPPPAPASAIGSPTILGGVPVHGQVSNGEQISYVDGHMVISGIG
jgi:hypothetical protein